MMNAKKEKDEVYTILSNYAKTCKNRQKEALQRLSGSLQGLFFDTLFFFYKLFPDTHLYVSISYLVE